MKSTKFILTGIMIMLLAIFAVAAGGGTMLWGAGVVLAPIAILVFIRGLFYKD